MFNGTVFDGQSINNRVLAKGKKRTRMQAYQPWVGDRAFGADSDNGVIVSYKSHQDAVNYLLAELQGLQGAGLLQGPKGSGKTTILRALVEQLPAGTAVALVDGSRLKSRELLSQALSEFGFGANFESNDELHRMMRVFAVQQARTMEAPLLIVDNVDHLYPSALATLNTLGTLEVQRRFALRIIVSARSGLDSLVESGGLANVERRCIGSYLIHPLSQKEALVYLHSRLAAGGINDAKTVFPIDVCDRLYRRSGGWPGQLNRHAAAAIARADDFPLTVDDTRSSKDRTAVKEAPVKVAGDAGRSAPRLIVSKDGKKLKELAINDKKILMGRSDFADVVIDDPFVSKLHATILAYSDALVLLDLNSVNGTTVNSVQISCTLLKNDDVISLGNHRLKVENAPPISAEMARLLKSPDTVRMKSLMDMRRVRARRLALAATHEKKRG